MNTELLKVLDDISNGKTEIYLNNKQVGDVGAASIAEALKVNSTVTDVWLGNNDIGDTGADSIAKALELNATVTKLCVGNCSIGDVGAASIAEALKANSSLTMLDLSNNQIRLTGAGCIAEALKINSTVIKLDLSNNIIGDVGAASIGEALEMNSTLTKLCLQKNQIGDLGVTRFAEGLKANSSLKNLEMYENQFGKNGACAVANGVKFGATAIRKIVLSTSDLPMEARHFSEDFLTIGEGKFGRALQGTCVIGGGFGVVLKVPHEESSNEALYESIVLQTLPAHKNVVTLIGHISDLAFENTNEKGKLKRIASSEKEQKEEDINEVAVSLIIQLHKNGSLKSYVEARAVQALKPFLRLALGMSKAIKHLHDHNILHRDIASRNYVLSDEYDPILIDFGLSCVIKEGQPAVSQPGEVFPIRHCAPESMSLRKFWKKSDVWMLGVTFWQMLGIDNGMPFKLFESVKSLTTHLQKLYFEENFEFPLFFEHKVLPEIKELINFCCRFNHLERPTIDELIGKIEELQTAAVLSSGEAIEGDSETAEKYFEGNEAKEGDLSVYAGGNYSPTDYHQLESDEEGMEEYYSAFPAAQGRSAESDDDADESDETDHEADDDKGFEATEVKEGDLSVYAGPDYSSQDYHSLEGDTGGGMEEYYSALSASQNTMVGGDDIDDGDDIETADEHDDANEAKEGDLSVYAGADYSSQEYHKFDGDFRGGMEEYYSGLDIEHEVDVDAGEEQRNQSPAAPDEEKEDVAPKEGFENGRKYLHIPRPDIEEEQEADDDGTGGWKFSDVKFLAFTALLCVLMSYYAVGYFGSVA